jgi:hypothetical protein
LWVKALEPFNYDRMAFRTSAARAPRIGKFGLP